MPEEFKYFINKYVSISEDDWDIIRKDFQKEIFQRNEVILEEGKICRSFYFFEKGLIRFYCHIDGNDITKTFAITPYCFTSKISFRNQTPANKGIQTLEKTIVWKINYTQLNGLPSIYLNVGENDELYDDSIQFYEKAKKAGINITLSIGKGMIHCYPLLAPLIPETNNINAFIQKYLIE